MVCLHVLKALLDLNYSVTIVTEQYSPAVVERNFRMGEIMARCHHIPISPFKPIFPRFLALQRLRYAEQVSRLIQRKIKPDLVFSTQSSLYFVPNVKTFSIVYDINDFFEVHASLAGKGLLAPVTRTPYYRLLTGRFHSDFRKNRLFIPLSLLLEQQLEKYEYGHTPFLFSPCDLVFRPRGKRKQVVQVTRVVPGKKLEEFMQIAARLSEYKFMMVGASSRENPEYARKLLEKAPSNVEYIEARIRDRPELVEESKVYLHTSVEPGINISLGQALGAGCIPVAPESGGGAEIVLWSKVGYSYRNIDEAVELIRRAQESEEPRDYPQHLSEVAKMFSAENFEEKIAKIILSGNMST